jgi:ribosomal protein L37AE/L43A
MMEDKPPNKELHNLGIELRKEESAFRTVKSCPFCHSTAISHRKWAGDYTCNNCYEYFKNPVFKQIKDRRDELPIPPTLRRKKTDDSASG